MNMNKKLIAGNWKMNGSLAANEALVQALVAGLGAQAIALGAKGLMVPSLCPRRISRRCRRWRQARL